VKNIIVLSVVITSIGAAIFLAAEIFDASGPHMHLSAASGKLVCPRLKNAYECARAFERRFLDKYSDVVSRQNGALVVKMADATHFLINDRDQLIQPMELQAHGRFLVIRQQLFEAEGWMLVDRLTGQITTTGGHPIFAPDFMRFVCATGAGFDSATLDVYVTTLDSTALEFTGGEDLPFMEIDNLKWTSNKTINFESIIPDQTSKSDGTVRRYMALELRAGSWVLKQRSY
jgi:hypothetical protein